jgi:hypothetical protein
LKRLYSTEALRLKLMHEHLYKLKATIEKLEEAGV